MMTSYMPRVFLIAIVALLAACDSREDETQTAPALAAEEPNSFLRYLNTQASLAAGRYQVVAATANAGESGSYSVTVTHDDGRTETLNGNWVSSGGANAQAAGNPRHEIVLPRAGGLRLSMNSAVDGHLFLLRNGRVVAQAADGGSGGAPLVNLALTKISSADYASAYYNAVDPDEERVTLDGFKRRNCFVAGAAHCATETPGCNAHVVFRDSKDLGYGRNMCARRNSDGSMAFIVDNYVIRLQAGSSGNYGPVNVEAAVREDRAHYRGTNAIEFTPLDPAVPASEKITRFFTYNTAGARITSADLDGRGVKHMPGMCWACHGGRLLPLEEDGTFPLLALRSAKLNQLEVDSFEFSTLPGFTQPEQEAGLRSINRFVHESYQVMQTRSDDEPGKWFAGFAQSIAEGRYGGPAFPSLTYQTGSVPPGWQRDPARPETMSRPEGVETLFKRVIEPHCVACHSLQGHNAGENLALAGTEPLANAINFSSWERFISHRELVIDYVFKRGVMPLSLRNFEKFWWKPQDKAALLAAFLREPSLFDAEGNVIKPGRPVARPGPARRVRTPVELDGSASSFAGSFRWQIVSGPAGAALTDENTATPVFSTTSDGDYVLALTVSNALGESAPAQLLLTVDSTAAETPTFVNDIMPILGSANATNCAVCHTLPGSSHLGIPVSYRTDNPRLYRDVLARVNLADAEMSALLRKPTSTRHGGGEQVGLLDLRTSGGLANYNTVLNWIRAGAPCGDDAAICP